ncbi:hypothetical protein FQN53_001531 [Emmonsiellopsis sp. PD_33]|nr:hypothetical protein FQN53_001531 [Emmonsiellopsis sp. PD_33]
MASNTPSDLQDAPQTEKAPETPKDELKEDSKEQQQDALDKEETREDDTESGDELEDGEQEEDAEGDASAAPPLPQEELPPPLPNEEIPGQAEDDGWDPVWDDSAQAYYFYNRFTGLSQWENPRVPTAQQGPPGTEPSTVSAEPPKPRVAGGYDPAIHGDYDPTAPYAQVSQQDDAAALASSSSADPNLIYTATGTFNRFTGKWQPVGVAPENFNDENKSRRQMNAYFDVDAAANSHDGKSLKAERSGKKLTKKELKAFKEKRRERKEEKRRAWLRD